MATGISWTDEVWNPTTGCTRVSAGCDHCYAFQVHDQRHVAWKRDRFPNAPAQYHVPFSTVQLLPERLDKPLRWKKPRRVFVNSMSDLFHEQVPDAFIDSVFATMAHENRHTYQVLTKRPLRALAWSNGASERVCQAANWNPNVWRWPLPNVHLGVSVENQGSADERIPPLLQTPAVVRMVSYEPALGLVDLGLNTATCTCCPRWASRWVRLHDSVRADGFLFPPVGGLPVAAPGVYRASSNPHGALSVRASDGSRLGIKPAEMQVLPGLDWVIVGGESGPRARPMDPEWARSMRDQCVAADVPFFFKQWGGRRAGTGTELDGREWHEFPRAVTA